MSTEIDHAMEFYDKARQAEEEKQLNLAEMYYVKSANLFKQLGKAHSIESAHALNALAFLRETRGDYSGALCSAKHSAEIMETQGIEFSSLRADEVRLQAWGLIGNLYRHMARYSEAEQILQHAFDYALARFGDVDEKTVAARNQLGVLYKYTGEFDKAEKNYRDALARLIAKYGE